MQAEGKAQGTRRARAQRALRHAISASWAEVVVVTHYAYQTWTQIRQHMAQYLLGFAACLVVVVVVAVLLTVLGNAPIIYLRVAELSASEVDLEVSTEASTGNAYVNYTLLASVLALDRSGSYSHHSPRTSFDTVALPCLRSDFSLDLLYNTSATEHCSGDWVIKTKMVALDTQREKDMLLGRTWEHAGPGAPGECLLSSKAARNLGRVGPGDRIVVVIAGPDQYYAWLWGTRKLPTLFVPLTVKEVFSDWKGKLSSDNIGIIVEYKWLLRLFAMSIDPRNRTFWANVTDAFNATDPYQYADTVEINLPPPRAAPYISSDFNVIRDRITEWASEGLFRAGFNSLSPSLPVLKQLYPFRYVALFLGLIINLSIIVLLFLCVLLIYSLLMINVDTRTFEVGVMRTLGTSRRGLVELLLTQALAYAIPSWAIGMAVAQGVAVIVFHTIESIASVSIPVRLTPTAIGVATALGIGIPILSAILPIRAALKKNLQESLDTRRSKTQAVKIEIERATHAGISWPLILIGILLSAFGFGVYYVFPISLLTFNFALLLNLFFVLLIAMLLGFVLLSLNIEHLLQQLLGYLFFFWDRAAILQVLLKNLVAHRIRNRKTTIMYAVSLSFIIFMYVTYAVQNATFEYQTKSSYGTAIRVTASGINGDSNPNVIANVAQLENFLRNDSRVEGFAWATVPLGLVTNYTLYATNIGHVFSNEVVLRGVSPNFFDITYSGFLKYGPKIRDDYFLEDHKTGDFLYSKAGSAGPFIGTLLSDNLKVGPGGDYLISMSASQNKKTESGGFFTTALVTVDNSAMPAPMRMRAHLFLDSSPTFVFSKFPSVVVQDALVSFPKFVQMSAGKVASVRSLPMGELFVKPRAGLAGRQIDELVDTVTKLSQSDYIPEVKDIRDDLSSMDLANKITNYFFIFTTIIAMTTSFFSLAASMLANVYEQTKEIGVLRALGVTKNWMYRVYMYEAFVVVFGASLLGLLIGTAVGWTITIQRVLFTQLPIPLIFPWQLLLVIFGLSVLFAFMSSLSPIVRVMSKPVVQIMRIVA
eukprot:m51a1_g9909 hypothetical protein (1044) ;mRNA; r:99120-103292